MEPFLYFKIGHCGAVEHNGRFYAQRIDGCGNIVVGSENRGPSQTDRESAKTDACRFHREGRWL